MIEATNDLYECLNTFIYLLCMRLGALSDGFHEQKRHDTFKSEYVLLIIVIDLTTSI